MNNEKLVKEIYSNWQACQSDLLRIKRNFNKAFEKRCAEINRGFLIAFLSKIPEKDLKTINNILIEIRKIYGSSPFWVNSDEFDLDDDKINDIENKLLEMMIKSMT
ncbi:hypothetical protein E4T80_04195 [Muribacter muris]|uniref:Uncharacterized protein n=1 Tax=Muribacter muris TaxID=67855 RepID=A0A4Y9K335_9PAST|nr:hypothetical protein [Muribacter muris]MBF0784679.1 hypothetical protein [Muribacter muris]MBF0828119.1 hypothetical protein [Muribacter muris]TFV11952.1 hypothetical protein E4T80_04195 [Muribacter muris]